MLSFAPVLETSARRAAEACLRQLLLFVAHEQWKQTLVPANVHLSIEFVKESLREFALFIRGYYKVLYILGGLMWRGMAMERGGKYPLHRPMRGCLGISSRTYFHPSL